MCVDLEGIRLLLHEGLQDDARLVVSLFIVDCYDLLLLLLLRCLFVVRVLVSAVVPLRY